MLQTEVDALSHQLYSTCVDIPELVDVEAGEVEATQRLLQQSPSSSSRHQYEVPAQVERQITQHSLPAPGSCLAVPQTLSLEPSDTYRAPQQPIYPPTPYPHWACSRSREGSLSKDSREGQRHGSHVSLSETGELPFSFNTRWKENGLDRMQEE